MVRITLVYLHILVSKTSFVDDGPTVLLAQQNANVGTTNEYNPETNFLKIKTCPSCVVVVVIIYVVIEHPNISIFPSRATIGKSNSTQSILG